MKHIGLFEGIGGFSLAARWAGWETIAWCEWNEFGQKVLRHHFPEATGHGDITKTDFTIYANKIDILTGGFPCQPYSTAGKRLGKDDERHLWPEMLRAIREIQPRWIVGENVLGLVSWNGGMVFEEVCAELEAEGYEVQPYVLPAAGVNAPHQRYRVWFVAKNVTNANSWGLERPKEIGWDSEYVERENSFDDVKDTNGIRQEWRLHKNESKDAIRKLASESNARINQRKGWDNFPTQAPVCNGNDGLSERLDSITFPKWRNESIKAGGNAIVPQVAYEIFKSINAYEDL
jgi:DNA (cytosine-5)-methyltransferase 1